uniref:Uncharacterized protein n=1 Tax=Anopheles epiroticus TaxID=199890 RepID=A0A182PGY7_9DIPT
MEQFSHDLTLALEETSRTNSSKVRWGVRRRTRSTGNLPCAPQPTEDSSSSPTDPPACNVVMNQADSPYLSGSNNIVQSDSDDRHSVAVTFKLRQTPLSGNFESDSLNENFSPARPNMRRKRKYKRMAVEYETTPSTPHIGSNPLFPVAGTVKKRVFKHSACPESFRSSMFFCGKRKRSQRDRGGMDYDFCKQHSSSVPRQREFFGPKGSSYSEYKSRNRAASFSASMMKCERILPLNKTVVSKIERISADRDRERSALLEASRSSAIVTPSAPVPVPTGGEFNFSIPLQQQQQQQQQVLLPGSVQQPAAPLDGGIILPLIGGPGEGGQGVLPQTVTAAISNTTVSSVPLNQPNLVGITPLVLPVDSLNPLQQLVASAAPTVMTPVIDSITVGQIGPLSRGQTKPLLVHPFGGTVLANPLNIQQSFAEKTATIPTTGTVTALAEPMKAAIVTKAKGSYPKEKHRHRKSKYIRKKQMLMMAGPEGQGQLMDCGGQDFLSSSSLSSSDSEAVLANETDHEGDDELTDWPGNEAMITFASKHDFRKAYHGNRAPSAATGVSSIALGRALLNQVDRQDEPDDDTLMSADELLTTTTANVPGTVGEITMQPVDDATVDSIGLGVLGPNLELPIGGDLSGISTPFLVNNIAPGLPLANEIREIRAGCRRIREERPGFSIISSVNELLSRFLQDDQQRELTLHDVDKAEHDKLQDLCKLYSLNAQQLSENGSVVMLSKTSNTMQSVRIDQSNLPKRLGDFKRRCYGNAEALQFHDGATS